MNLQIHRPHHSLEAGCHVTPTQVCPGTYRADEIGVDSRVSLPLEVDWLIFSAEEILYDATDWWRWVVKLLGHMGLQTHYDALYGVWRRDYLDAVNRREIEYWSAFRQFLRAVGLRPVQIAELLVAAQPRRKQFEREFRCLPGVALLLGRLYDSRIPMGVISCVPLPSEVMVNRLRGLGLADFFSFVTTAWDLQCSTSQAALYERLIRERGGRSNHFALMGRDPLELAAAAEAGMATVSCNQHREAHPDVRVPHPGQITQVVIPCATQRMAG